MAGGDERFINAIINSNNIGQMNSIRKVTGCLLRNVIFLPNSKHNWVHKLIIILKKILSSQIKLVLQRFKFKLNRNQADYYFNYYYYLINIKKRRDKQ
jgi:hypothetical protein